MGKKPDRTLLNDIFGDGGHATTGTRPQQQKDKAVKPTNSNKDRFTQKIADEDFHEFDHKDWLEYFKMKAKEQRIHYIIGNFAKEYAILKSLMGELHWDAIKAMIDFLFDSDQDTVPKRTAGVVHLSKGWVNTIYQESQAWIKGEYTPKTAPKRNREYKEPSVASRKDAGTGILYGKPVVDVIIKKGSVRF